MPMTHRQRALACLNYQDYDRLPILHFGFWDETLAAWQRQGHIAQNEVKDWPGVARKLGFDYNWSDDYFGTVHCLRPGFEHKLIEQRPDGSKLVQNGDGVIILQAPGAVSIPSEFDHLLKDRASWEKHYLPRLQWHPDRVPPLGELASPEHDDLRFICCGSMFGTLRNLLGVVGSAYVLADDEPLFDEMVDTICNLMYRCTEEAFNRGGHFDIGHFWEDICFKTGPLINPEVFRAKMGPHYRRFADLLASHGITLINLDCDGMIDDLIPVWLDNGANVMFPIEVGTWNASIKPWREKYGKALRGVGGVDKRIFARDKATVDAEVERLKPLVALGGFIPCVDHRIPPEAKWELVCYYTEQMRKTFGG